MQKTVALQHTGRIVDVTVVIAHEVPTIQSVQKMVEVPQSQYLDRVVDVPVAIMDLVGGKNGRGPPDAGH